MLDDDLRASAVAFRIQDVTSTVKVQPFLVLLGNRANSGR
jgi:hypothetical protein